MSMNAGKKSTVKIIDDLTDDTTLSTQRKYQIRMMRKGLCVRCGRKAYRGMIECRKHLKKRGIKEIGKNGARTEERVGNVAA